MDRRAGDATGMSIFDRTVRRFDPFRILSETERERHLSGYLRHLQERNGTPDLAARTLSRRELAFAEIEAKPVEWEGDVDSSGFYAHLRGDARPEIDARTLWLLAVAKANEGESYGVDLELKAFVARGQENVDPIMLYLMLEEQYHSRILVEACRTCGLDVKLAKPKWAQRWVVHLFQTLPERLGWIPVFCGEVVGSNVFRMLRDNCHLFAAQPEVEERLRFLLGEIYLDEILHVAFLRARLQPWALRIARSMLSPATALLMKDVPQLGALGCDRSELLRRIYAGLEIPRRVDWLAADPD